MGRSISFDFNAVDRASAVAAKLGQEMDELGRKIERAGGTVDVEVDIDTAKYDAKIARIEARKLKVEADIAGAVRDLQVLEAEAKNATGDRKVKIDADIGVAQAKLAALRAQLGSLDRERVTIRPDVNIAPAVAKLAVLRTQLAGLQAVNQPLNITIGVAGALAAIGAVRNALAGLGGGLGLISIGAVGAAGVAAGALKGIGDAVTALGQKDTSVSSKMQSNSNAVASAIHGVEQAQRGLRNAHEAVADAQIRVQDTARGIERAQRDVQDALRGVQDAQQALTDANRDALRAEEDLNDARKDAIEHLQDLSRREEDMQASRASAALSVMEAQERLNQVMVDPRATDVQRARAQLNLSEAQRRVKTLAEDAQRLKDEKAEADKKGVEGSDQVRSALDRQDQAQRRVKDAQQGVVDANRRVADSQQGVIDAQRQHELALRGVRDAQEGVKDAAFQLAQAQNAVREASQKAGAAGASGMNKLQEAMAGLTPEARRFAEYLRSIIDGPLQRLRETAQRSFLPGLQRGIQGAGANINQDQLNADVGNIGTNLGAAFERIGPSVGRAVQQFARLASIVSDTAFSDFAGLIENLLDAFSNWAERQDAETIRQKLDAVKGAFWDLVGAGKVLIDFVNRLGQMVGPLSVVTGALLAVRGAFALVQGAAALSVVPFAGWILGIAAVGAALFILYQKSEAFRKVVDDLWSTIKTQAAQGWAYLKPKFDEIKKVIEQDLVPAFTDLATALAPYVKVLIETVGPTTVRIFGGILTVIKGALQIISGVIKVVTGVISGDWRKAWEGIKLIVSGIWTAIKGLVTIAINAVKQLIQVQMNLISTIWRTAWNGLKDAARSAWEGIKSAARSAYDWLSRNVFEPVKSGIKKVSDSFSAAKDSIGRSWDQIRDKAKAPVRFVINTVMGNLVDKFNAISGRIGGPTFTPPRASFASGGIMPGYTPGQDVHRFYSPTAGILDLSGGEAVMRPEFTRQAGGKAGIDALNRLAMQGRLAEVLGSLPYQGGFAGGGILDFIKSKSASSWDWVSDKASSTYDLVTHPGKLLSGVVSGIPGGGFFKDLAVAAGNNMVDHAKTFLVKQWESFKGVFDKSGIGASNATGVAGLSAWARQNGLTVTSGYRPGSITASGNLSYHAMGRAIDVVPATMATFEKALRAFPNAAELIFSPAGNRQLKNGRPHYYTGAVRNMHFNHVHIARKLGGTIPTYDNGGYLPPGLSTVYNGTGMPEPVLTARQWDGVVRGAGSGSSGLGRLGRGGDTYITVPVTNAVIGNEQQVGKVVVQAVKAAQNNGTLRGFGR